MCLYKAQISGEGLQNHLSSGLGEFLLCDGLRVSILILECLQENYSKVIRHPNITVFYNIFAS